MEKKRINRFCEAAALAAFVLLTAVLALCALTMTAQNEASDNIMLQTVTLVREPPEEPAAVACRAGGTAGVHRLLERMGGVRLGAGLCALWLAAALCGFGLSACGSGRMRRWCWRTRISSRGTITTR